MPLDTGRGQAIDDPKLSIASGGAAPCSEEIILSDCYLYAARIRLS